jgi:hypothetical protein
MARKVDGAANFVFMQLIEKEPGIYEGCSKMFAPHNFSQPLTKRKVQF